MEQMERVSAQLNIVISLANEFLDALEKHASLADELALEGRDGGEKKTCSACGRLLVDPYTAHDLGNPAGPICTLCNTKNMFRGIFNSR